MDMLKQKWRVIVFGAVVAASVGLGTWGVLRGDVIHEQMKIPDQMISKLKSLTGSGANPEMIEAKKRDLAKAKEEVSRAIKAGQELQEFNAFEEEVGADGKVTRKPREPIVRDVLPKPATPGAAFNFRDEYKAQMARLTKRLNAGPPPSREDVMSVDVELRNKKTMRSREEIPVWALWEGAIDADAPEPGTKPGDKAPSRVDILKNDAPFLAAIERARAISMYLDLGALGEHPLKDQSEPPTAEQIWQAQMALWIQQDIVTALARVNERAAAELTKDGHADRVWVAYLPVKRLEKLAIAHRLGRGGGLNTLKTDFAPSFRGLNNSESMFVVPMQLVVVVDVRAIPELLRELARVNFYTPINMTIEAIPPDPIQQPFVYGPAPVARVQIDFEGYFLRSVFEKFIPESLKPILAAQDARDTQRPDGR